MIVGARELGAAINRHSQKVSTLVLNRSAAGLDMDLRVTPLPAKLVLTSPPTLGCTFCIIVGKSTGGRRLLHPFGSRISWMAPVVATTPWRSQISQIRNIF